MRKRWPCFRASLGCRPPRQQGSWQRLAQLCRASFPTNTSRLGRVCAQAAKSAQASALRASSLGRLSHQRDLSLLFLPVHCPSPREEKGRDPGPTSPSNASKQRFSNGICFILASRLIYESFSQEADTTHMEVNQWLTYLIVYCPKTNQPHPCTSKQIPLLRPLSLRGSCCGLPTGLLVLCCFRSSI